MVTGQFNGCLQGTSLFTVIVVWQLVVFVVDDFVFRQDGIAVIASLERNVLSENHLHRSRFGEYSRLVLIFDSGRCSIYFLQ